MIETLFLLKIIFLVNNWTENVKTAITKNYRQYCKVQTKLKYNQMLKKMYQIYQIIRSSFVLRWNLMKKYQECI